MSVSQPRSLRCEHLRPNNRFLEPYLLIRFPNLVWRERYIDQVYSQRSFGRVPMLRPNFFGGGEVVAERNCDLVLGGKVGYPLV